MQRVEYHVLCGSVSANKDHTINGVGIEVQYYG